MSMGLNIPMVTRDITTIVNAHPLTGMLSNLGILLWCSTSSICLFTVLAFFRKLDQISINFLLGGGVISAYLLFDDLFSFHENLAPKYLGFSEISIYISVFLIVLFYIRINRKIILETQFSLLIIALFFLGISIFTDVFWKIITNAKSIDWFYLIEDGTKWLGIVGWFSYYLQSSMHVLNRCGVIHKEKVF
jgi:hypothetical protein